MPLGFSLYPAGILENSPTFQFQRWVRLLKRAQVPKGRPKRRADLAVPRADLRKARYKRRRLIRVFF